MIDKDTIVIPVTHLAVVSKMIDTKGAQFIAVKRGEIGYWVLYSPATAEGLNGRPLTDQEIDAAITASMFGWHVGPLTKPIHDWLFAREQEMERGSSQPAG